MKQARKRKLVLSELEKVVNILASRKKLPTQYNDHSLSGDFVDFRECHIKLDWLLIYTIDNEELELFLKSRYHFQPQHRQQMPIFRLNICVMVTQ